MHKNKIIKVLLTSLTEHQKTSRKIPQHTPPTRPSQLRQTEQWLNRWDRGQSALQNFWPGNFCWPIRKKRGKWKKGKNGEKKENCKKEGVKLKWKEGKLQNEERTFFFSFYFSNPLKFVLGLTKWKFSTGKKHFTPGKKSGKITLPPQKKIPGTPLKQNIKRHVDTLTPSTPPHSLLQKS